MKKWEDKQGERTRQKYREKQRRKDRDGEIGPRRRREKDRVKKDKERERKEDRKVWDRKKSNDKEKNTMNKTVKKTKALCKCWQNCVNRIIGKIGEKLLPQNVNWENGAEQII